MRLDGRKSNELRKIDITLGVNKYAEGSCLISYGNTRVMCTATVEEKIPFFLKDKNSGWVTAEYNMLPRSTQQRLVRDREKLNGRTMEIQRLIGRSLRGAIHLEKLGPRQIILDCDVLQADGGTRSASITGGFVALWLACDGLVKNKILSTNPIKNFIGAISGGIYKDELLLDLDYQEDSITESDMNFILNDMGNLIEIQGTAEGRAFSWDMLHQLFLMASSGVAELIYHQKKTLGLLYD